MDSLIRFPDIVNPDTPRRRDFRDKTFVKDVGFDDLLGVVPFQLPETKEFARSILVEQNADLATIKYRQDVFENLVSDNNLRSRIRKNVSLLFKLSECLKTVEGISYMNLCYKWHGSKYTPVLSTGIDLLNLYKDFIDNPFDMSSAKSEAIKEVNAYLNEIKQSSGFSVMSDFLSSAEKFDKMDFRISFDDGCRPSSLTVMALDEENIQKKPQNFYLKHKFGKKKDILFLQNKGELSELGKLLQSYLEQEFAPVFREYAVHIKELTCITVQLDFYVGFADYFSRLKELKLEVCRPILLAKEARLMRVKNAGNPLMLGRKIFASKISNTAFFQKSRNLQTKIVPNDISYNADENMFIITGPNNGGKTTYVKTVVLIQTMSSAGLFVPASSAEVSMVDGIYTHFIAPDDIINGEGRYRNELKRVKEIIEQATPYSLVILDEPCGGTGHEEGIAQSLSFLNMFHNLGTAIYFTTHMHKIAEEVEKGRFSSAKNLYVECIKEKAKIKYTFKIKTGTSGKSYSEEIAKEVGLISENLVQAAFRKASEKGYVHFLRRY